MPLNETALVLIGLLLAAWSIAAGVAIVWASRRARRADASRRLVRRLSRVVEESPAQPLLVRADGKIEGSPRLAGWLGFPKMPGYLSELVAAEAGLDQAQLAGFTEAVRRTQKTGAPFRLVIAPKVSSRSLEMRGMAADPDVAAGAVLVWVFDFSEHASELERLGSEAERARASYNGLAGLLESAPMPMWFRGSDLKLMLVNSAYVDAVGGESAEAAIAGQCELLERTAGKSPAEVAGQALSRRTPVERVVSATIHGQRRTLRVRDLPLDGGVAGFAWDIEDFEEQKRAFRAFREAQRQMLDILSAAIAQFDGARRLTFANESFLRLFGLQPSLPSEAPPFERLLETMRGNGRLPEVRDFPQWRRERLDWFTAGAVQHEEWRLGDGTHWRVVAQPTPEGGLLLILEDRTEQLQLAATRDTLLRTRTATFDNLFESLAVFAPDGRLQLWNRRFAAEWGLKDSFLDEHPHVDDLLEQIAPRLRRPQQALVVGTVIRAATLERIGRGGRLALADGRHLEFAGVPLPDGNGLLTVLDITDSQKAESALKQLNAALVEADAVKTRFIANMAYDFRTPLTSIGGFAELLQSGMAGELNEQAQEYVGAILASTAMLGEQIENVLDLAQSEAGTLPIQRAPVELRALVKEVLKQRRGAADERGVSLDLRGGDAMVPVEGDSRRLARAVGQLVDNAVAASRPGGTVLVELARRSQGGARLAVSDEGEGMEPLAIAHALDGLRVSSDGKSVEQRQGLGLPLARQLIEGHGGTLELHSQPGEGTSAIVRLP